MKLSGYIKTIVLACMMLFPAGTWASVTTLPEPDGSDSIIVKAMREVGVTFSHNNSVTLLTSGKEKFDDMFEAIRHAKSSIHLEYFNFRNDSIANALFDLLAEKVKEGVEVRALFDAFGNSSNNRPLKKKHVRYQRSRGIKLYEFSSLHFPWLNHLKRDHRKIVVIDGAVAYTGGMNVADYYIHGTEVVGSWHDMHCRITGDEVNDLQAAFIRMWKKVTGEEIIGEQYFNDGNAPILASLSSLKPDTTATSTRKMVGIVNREPRRSSKIMRQMYIKSIDSAKDSIRIINPYFTLLSGIRKALNRAIDRGVKVDIMIASKSDIPLSPDCAFYNLHKLMKRGANVWIFEDGFHHTKMMTVDDKFCTVGSCNLDGRSLRWDYEVNALIIDSNTTAEMMRLFDNDKKKSFILTEKKWKEWRSCSDKFRGWFGHLLAFWL